jgi:hypothetical protein
METSQEVICEHRVTNCCHNADCPHGRPHVPVNIRGGGFTCETPGATCMTTGLVLNGCKRVHINVMDIFREEKI